MPAELVVMVDDGGRFVTHPPAALPRAQRQLAVLVVGEPLLGEAAERLPHVAAYGERRTGNRATATGRECPPAGSPEVPGPNPPAEVDRVPAGVRRLRLGADPV